MAQNNIFKCKVKVWLYPGSQSGGGRWHFVTIPVSRGKAIKKSFGAAARGWGSLKVKATIGKTNWDTSIFPDKKFGSYLLPIKAKIRKKVNIESDSVVNLTIEIMV